MTAELTPAALTEAVNCFFSITSVASITGDSELKEMSELPLTSIPADGGFAILCLVVFIFDECRSLCQHCKNYCLLHGFQQFFIPVTHFLQTQL